MSARPKVILADDHAMLLAAFEKLLAPACDVVGTFTDGRAVVEAAERLRPDVLVLDISMPVLNGMDVCRQLRPVLPRARWIFLTVNEDADCAVEAFRLGASAYLLKASAVSELFAAIQMAARGERFVTPLLSRGASLEQFLKTSAAPGANELTSRQRQVLRLLADGRAMKQVADELKVTPRTVAFHKYTLMKQLGVKTNAGLFRAAVKLGLVQP
jgi:DNA-binding NarL/FixJ family response regulator